MIRVIAYHIAVVMTYNQKYYVRNRKKEILRGRLYRKKNGKKINAFRQKHKKKICQYTRWWHFKKKYGLSPEGYFDLVAKKQKFRCALCNELFKGKSGFSKIHVDHCHKSGKVRGIIHSSCNLLLGLCKDDITFLKKAIRYLKKHQK